MVPMPRPHPLATAALLAVLLAGCGGGGGEAADAAAEDSASAAVVNGVPLEDIQQKASPMTPEQAQAMGIDSAIGPTRLEASDSGPVLPPGYPRDAAIADTTSPP